MKAIQVRNTQLKPGMHVKLDGQLRTIRKIFPGCFDLTVVEFLDGDRTALSLRTSSTIVTIQ